MKVIEETKQGNAQGRQDLAEWEKEIGENLYLNDEDFQHSVSMYLGDQRLENELVEFAERVAKDLDPLVQENHQAQNLPRIEHYDGVGQTTERVVHHPSYAAAGDIIYGSRIMERMAKPGGLLEALTFMFLSSQAGEAGHNCPVACSAGIIRVLQKVEDFPQKDFFMKKLIEPSYRDNFTGAQFVTEVQGGSDVGSNAAEAYKDAQGRWLIQGEKWFCSNADADLILMTARFNPSVSGTKGLGLFCVPAVLETGERNHYTMRRLKEKLGTKTLATAEMDFHGAHAIPMGSPENGFKVLMENVLHISRIFNAFCVVGMGRRAFHIALSYAKHRKAFGKPIINYPLVQENLARIKSENTALMASIFAATKLQDDFDVGKIEGDEAKLLLRLLANLNKYLTALWAVEHIHHSLDVLAGNGTIESFSSIPRLLDDSIICENWEGTHNVLRMQILRDILRYEIDKIFINHLLEEGKNPNVDRLKRELEAFRSSGPELQSLQIKSIVHQMALIYASLQLQTESQHQLKMGNDSKKRCLDLFLRIHMDENSGDIDREYLNMVGAIVSLP
ncbi:MAG: putative acyl-CoA dehydrogenase AidB [Chlamydiae bacterium]|nr:putative acyl-CoA dehydrogenase AidB [Chlamydiota bacterium]